MTRINVVAPADLTDQHLMAEWRELPRVFTLAIAAAARDDLAGPERYTLGTGHVRFFYTRLPYLARRHADLTTELAGRGFNLTPRPPLAAPFGHDWQPGGSARRQNVARLSAKILLPPRPNFYTYGGIPVGLDFYNRLNQETAR